VPWKHQVHVSRQTGFQTAAEPERHSGVKLILLLRASCSAHVFSVCEGILKH
jgi:hypothetical protein